MRKAILLVALLVLMGCGGGALKASAVKPYSDQLAAVTPVLVDEVLPIALEHVKDEKKRERILKYADMAKVAAIGIKAVVDAAAAAEEEKKE